jgi:hypothetical protein
MKPLNWKMPLAVKGQSAASVFSIRSSVSSRSASRGGLSQSNRLMREKFQLNAN